MSQFSTSHSSGSCALSPLLRQPYRNPTQSTPSHEWNETGRFTKEYLEQHPPAEVKSLQELFEDDTFLQPAVEVPSFSETLRVDEAVFKEQMARAEEGGAFETIQAAARALDMYVHHMDLVLHEHRILDECWKHYKQLYEREGGKAITALTVLQQQTSKSSRKLLLLERLVRESYGKLECCVPVLRGEAKRNRALAAEVTKELGSSTTAFRTKCLAIAAEQERLAALLTKVVATVAAKADQQAQPQAS